MYNFSFRQKPKFFCSTIAFPRLYPFLVKTLYLLHFFQTDSRSIILGVEQLKHYIYCTSFRPIVDRLSSGSSSEFHVVLLQIPIFWLAVAGTLSPLCCVQWLPSLSTNDVQFPLSIYMLEERGRCKASMFQSVIYSGYGIYFLVYEIYIYIYIYIYAVLRKKEPKFRDGNDLRFASCEVLLQ